MIQIAGNDVLRGMFAGAAARIRKQHELLSQLDSVAGDGDHGTTMLRTVDRLESAVIPGSSQSWRGLFRDAGWSVLGVDGGASSSLIGTFLSGVAEAPGEFDQLNCQALAAGFEAGLRAAQMQTKARVGDKTMMDALQPAVGALREAAEAGKCLSDAMHKAAEAARVGAESTQHLIARYGRAKYQGEKTLGHLDPGAVSIALLFEGFCDGLAEVEGDTRDG
jgi:dihydroxyacetone kinase-like protein